MANKIAPKISSPGSAKMPTKGPHNPNVGKHGGAQKVNVKAAAPSPGGSFLPVQNNAMANLRNQSVGQQNPQTAAAATKKPNRKGGAAFYGES